MMLFPTDYSEILQQVEQVDVSRYGTTRNYLDGSVTRLSPFISRGVISLPWLRKRLTEKFSVERSERIIYQLAWREYFQRVWWHYGNGIFSNLHGPARNEPREGLPTAIAEATTTINVIDDQIERLYSDGYIHNHVRMYIASLTCSFARCDWKSPSRWMYYHLLDGDIASNILSWQWVAGTFSRKPYVFNQENLNHYSNTSQRDTFIDVAYENISSLTIPDELLKISMLSFPTKLPVTSPPTLDPAKPLLLYNSYNLDPVWEKNIDANRVLLLEPSHFKQFPVSEKVIDFILNLSSNIRGLQVFTGEWNDLPDINKFHDIRSKEHPAFLHYPGEKTPAQWMFPDVKLTRSFSSFWKSCKILMGTIQHQ